VRVSVPPASPIEPAVLGGRVGRKLATAMLEMNDAYPRACIADVLARFASHPTAQLGDLLP
jgi:hypothetical protein